MKISFRCPNCQAKHSALPSQAGKEGICKKCKAPLTVPISEPSIGIRRGNDTITSKENLIDGFKHPFVTGAKLWSHSFLPLVKRIGLPIAGLVFVAVLFLQRYDFDSNPTAGMTLLAAAGLAIVYVIFVIDLLISHLHTGNSIDNIYHVATRRFLPTAVTWLIAIIAVFMGTLLLIIPGIILGLRLFWADEFALVNGQTPIAAIRSSFDLTRAFGGRIWLFQFLEGLLSYGVFLAAIFILIPVAELKSLIATDLFTALWAAVLFLLFTLGYSFLHASEVAYFYGLRAEKAIDTSSNE